MTHPYASEGYARSLAHMGELLVVPEWGGPVLTRPVEASARRDATGPYPLTVIARGADLRGGLARMSRAGLISAVVVLDDRLRPPLAELEGAFDFVRPFKTHYLYDRRLGPPVYDKHHRYELRRATASVEVAEIDLRDHGSAWRALYAELAARHGVSDLHAFPGAYHRALEQLSGLRSFGAFIDGRLASAHLFVAHERYAISHLAASSAEGYAARAAYAVNDLAIAQLSDCEVVNFGGGAGTGDDRDSGLARFKRGFSNAEAPSWLCGKTLDAEAYAALSAGCVDSGFFPAYRGHRIREPSDAH